MPRKKMGRREFRKLIELERQKLDQLSDSDQEIVVNVSGGKGSAVAAIRAHQWWGDRCRPVFADTSSEHPDTYRFLRDLEGVIGPIDRLVQYKADGSPKDIWDCFDEAGVMRIPKANNACIASIELKQKPLDAYSSGRVSAVGFGFQEAERAMALNERRRSVYPLFAAPLLTDCQLTEVLEAAGLSPPAVYRDGFVHNNCLGVGGCILSGLAQFAAVRQIDPDRFEYARSRSDAFFQRTGFSVLRDQRGGDVKSYTLTELAADQDSGRDFGDDWKSNCGCMTGFLFPLEELI